jgi:predicted RNA polymerase sigma factor
MSLSENDAHATAEMVARRSYGKLVAFLASRTHDVAAAEDALSEAFTAALADWPRNGCPANPEAWLLTVARRKAIDMHRAWGGRAWASHAWDGHEPGDDQLQSALEVLAAATALNPQSESGIPDQRLALMFACAHPAIDAGVRAPLILQVILGLDAKAIASSFLTSPAAMGKRLVRAKEKIREAGVPFRIPEIEELAARLGPVLDAIYAAYTEGWTDPGGADVSRRSLTEEALFLAALVAELLPHEPEALGLLALMLHSEARRRARRTADGDFAPLADQDSDLWDAQMIFKAEALLRRAGALRSLGRYQLEAAVQSAHVYRCRTGYNNWVEIAQLYDALFTLTGSPVVAINRALAIAEVQGPDAALEAMPSADDDARLAEYQPYWAARAELLARTGAHSEARRAYELAIGLEHDNAVRRFLQQRQSKLGDAGP